MATKRILFIGGTGTISYETVKQALTLGHEVTLLNRGETGAASGKRPVPEGVELVTGDIRQPETVRAALGDREFDSVVECIAFTTEHVKTDLELFEGRTGQYVFISSASAYQTPPLRVPVTESTPLRNPFWQYSRDKIACEDLLVSAYRERGLPITIIRPTHTYDRTSLPTTGGWTDIARLREGKPVVIHGDGTSLWTITHSRDVAVGFAGLLAHPLAIGEAFQIMGDHTPTWNQIYGWLAQAAGVDSPDFVHVASETIARVLPEEGPGLLGDKAHSMVFDTSKLRALVPEFATTVTYEQGAAETIEWFDAHPEAQTVDPALDAGFDRLVAHARSI